MPPGSPATLDLYLDLFTNDSEERRFLRGVPWLLDSGTQGHEDLLRSMITEAPRLASLPRRPVFTLLTPMYNTPARLLRELILSVRAQTYPHWELILVDDGSPRKDHLETAREWAHRDPRIKLFACEINRGISGARNFAIEQSTGDFLAILDHDDLLHPMALGYYARTINADPDLNLIFCNECQIDDSALRTYGYFYKPKFDLFTLLRANYVCHFTAIRRDLMMAAHRDGRIFRSEYDGAEDHDLFARVGMTGMVKSHHVPLFLYLWRAVPTSCSSSLDAKPEIPERRLRLLADLLPQIYPGGSFEFANPDETVAECHLKIRIRSIAGVDRPSVLVVIPPTTHFDSVRLCLEVLEQQEHDLDVRVCIAVPPSESQSFARDLATWKRSHQLSCEVTPAIDPAFPSRTLNSMVNAQGREDDLVLFLRHDIEIKTPHALQTMAMQLLADPSAAFIGVKIAETDPRFIRSAGIKVFESSDGAGYHCVGSVRSYRDYVNDEHLILGVSLRCAMVRRATYLELNGLDEVVLSNAYADLDICAHAIERGYRNYYFGTLLAVEHAADEGIIVVDREFERSVLWERHARTLQEWRLRMLTHTYDSIWSLDAPVSNRDPMPGFGSGEVPTRYKVADKINAGLKKALGPLHGVMKKGLHGSWRVAKTMRRPMTSMKTIYRPQLVPKLKRAVREVNSR